MSISLYEKETTITYNEAEKTATVYTHNNALIRKLTEYCDKYPDQYKLKKQDEYSKTFEIPKKYISFRQPIVMSEERKEKMRERAKQLFHNKNLPHPNSTNIEEGTSEIT